MNSGISTDYSYLEEMSVKQLKELRDAINEILGDGGGSSGAEVVTEEVFNNSKTAYEKLVSSSEIGLTALKDIYDAWYYDIYNNKQGSWKTFCDNLSLSSSDLEEGIKTYDAGYGYILSSDDEDYQKYKSIGNFFNLSSYGEDFWMDCVNYVIFAYQANENKFNTLEQDLNDAKTALKIVGDEYSDYKYYPNLKEFYSTVSALYDFVSNPTGSFETLKTTKTEYESKIRNFKSDLSFVFED